MNAENSVVGYLTYKETDKNGFCKYGYFKRIISYILDFHNDYYIRKLFLKMYDKGFFIKEENIKKSFKYQFNPNPKIENNEKNKIKNNEPVTITFD